MDKQFADTEERLAGPPSTRALRLQPSTRAWSMLSPAAASICGRAQRAVGISRLSARRSGVFSEQISVVSVWPVKGGEEQRPELTVAAREPSSAGLAPEDDQRPARSQDRAEVLQRAVTPDVEDQVVAAPSGRDVLTGVVDGVVRGSGRCASSPCGTRR
jgi:hypothetical protein